MVLHVGDFDPSGVGIFEAATADIAAFFEHDRILASQQLITERLALTADQVAEHELPTSPAKASDSRSQSWRGETCQLEALAPDVLADIVTAGIESWLSMPKLHAAIEREQDERTQLLHALPSGATP